MQEVARAAVREYVERVSRRELIDEVLDVRDVGLLGSALARPRASAFGADAYGTLDEKAAALLPRPDDRGVARRGDRAARLMRGPPGADG